MSLYNWENIINNNFELVNTSIHEVIEFEITFENLSDEIKALIKPFCLNYQTTQIPVFNKNQLEGLLRLNNVDVSLEEFITIGCSLQYQYILGLQMNQMSDLVNDFDEEKKDYESFLNIIERFLFSDNHRNLHSILFKYNLNQTTKINNFFIVRDIYESICIGYGINKDNFHERKAQILSMTNQILLSKLGEKIKTDYAQKLYYLIEPKFSKDADIFRYIGAFFHIFQVPTNRNQPIELYDDISETLKSIDIKNFRHYINGRLKLLHD